MKILVVDDDSEFCEAAAMMLNLLNHDVITAHSLDDALECLEENLTDKTPIEHVLLDFMLPDGSGLHLIDAAKKFAHPPFITLVTGHPSVKQMVSALTGPKVNYILKPVTKQNLEAALVGKNPKQDIHQDFGVTRHFGCLVGESPAMKLLYTMIERVSKTHANVMLMGESGTGKEVVANAIHNASQPEGPLVASNCGAFSRDLISSELFGHEKGAFTGAISRKVGVFEQAQYGTLFLDEVTEMPIEYQPNLLRALETQQIVRVGGSKEIPINCRVISATNRSEADIAEKQVLREDIYFRLAVFPIRIPPLRERKSDIPSLSQLFLAQLNYEHNTAYTISDTQIDRLLAYDWPGNVRELKHAIHRAYIMADPTTLEVALPQSFASPFTKNSKSDNQLVPGQRIDDVERELIHVTLAQLDGDKPQAAKMLGISLKTLYNRLNKYGECESESSN
ncbi:MAG TPA: sigma-54 dependent transcriptional regulator [Marinagarivorans sp.]